MIRNISIGIDVGTSTTRVVVGEFVKGSQGEKNPKIIGIGEAKTLGLRRGYVVNSAFAAESVKKAVRLAEEASGIKVRRAFLSLGGASLRGETGSGTVIISKADGEVTNLDVSKALEEAEGDLGLTNKKVIHSFPLSFRLDGKEVLGRVEGMRGNKLEVKALFVIYSIPHLEDIIEVVDQAGVEVIDVIASPLASSHVALSDKQKIVGGALADIGAETTTLSVFENGSITSMQTFPIGGEDITNDIALGLKIPIERAEEFKRSGATPEYSKKKLEEIIEARLSDIFELVENHLKKIKRSELLPAGIVFSGGGANTLHLEECSQSALNLPSKVGVAEMFGSNKTKLRDPAWFNALGLLLISKDSEGYSNDSFSSFFKTAKSAIKSSIKQLLP